MKPPVAAASFLLLPVHYLLHVPPCNEPTRCHARCLNPRVPACTVPRSVPHACYFINVCFAFWATSDLLTQAPLLCNAQLPHTSDRRLGLQRCLAPAARTAAGLLPFCSSSNLCPVAGGWRPGPGDKGMTSTIPRGPPMPQHPSRPTIIWQQVFASGGSARRRCIRNAHRVGQIATPCRRIYGYEFDPGKQEVYRPIGV